MAIRPPEPGETGTLKDLTKASADITHYLRGADSTRVACGHESAFVTRDPAQVTCHSCKATIAYRVAGEGHASAVPEPDPISACWVCNVVRSGYHNGAGCTPADPHGYWGCGYRYELSMPATAETEAFLRAHGFNPQPAA